MRLTRNRFKLYRYRAGELAPEEQARRKRPRLSTNRILYWHVGRWVYCARVTNA